MLKTLRRKKPARPTLFEFFLNERLYKRLAADDSPREGEKWAHDRMVIRAFRRAGYDYATVNGSDFKFPADEVATLQTVSINSGVMIRTREDFEKFDWPDPASFDYSRLEALKDELTDGMKLVLSSPGGILENVTWRIGHDNLCYMLVDDPALLADVFEAVGNRYVKYFELCAGYDSVGAMLACDDWGFKTQTILSPADMRKYVFPWYRKIAQVAHKAGKPIILHSCGQLGEIMDDIIDDMKFDAKHSYEDAILPVEDAYEKYHSRIAVLGGIDLDFVVRGAPEEIYRRSRAMLERTADRGGYALGTGNSVPEYVPDRNYFAMVRAALDARS